MLRGDCACGFGVGGACCVVIVGRCVGVIVIVLVGRCMGVLRGDCACVCVCVCGVRIAW